ncbi:MAG: leucine-rich repeat domain-containing protein [Clostridiales bacterium]|nr:leucine-rich repeat domain-containing protein [Clostridiales bacterium]
MARKKKKQEAPVIETDEVIVTDEDEQEELSKIGEEALTEEKYFDRRSQDIYFGARNVIPFDNGNVLNGYMKYKFAAKCRYKGSNEILTLSGEKVGILPKIPLDAVWKKLDDAGQVEGNKCCEVTKGVWEKNVSILKSSLGKNACVQDVLSLSAIDLSEMGLSRQRDTLNLIKRAIDTDMAESKALEAKWKKIKNYKHKVPLGVAVGGIFTNDEVNVIFDAGIQKLNDIRKSNIYQLKSLLPGRSFANIISELNEAFKEHLARRRDIRLKIYPFIFGFLALAATGLIAFWHRYTIIKAHIMQFYEILLLVWWLANVGIMVYSAFRAKKRRKKVYSYRYFSRRVIKMTSVFGVIAIAVIGCTALYNFRYDGYNDIFYYCNEGDGIVIAGFVDSNINAQPNSGQDITVDDQIDGKTVVGIAARAFRGESFQSIYLAQTVTKIGDGAFSKNEGLTEVYSNAGGLIEVGKKAFEDCDSLTGLYGFEAVEQIGKKAFKDCQSLDSISAFRGLNIVGEGAFEGCSSLTAIDLTVAPLTEIGVGVFAGCENLTNVTLPSTMEGIPAKTFYGCSALNDISLPESMKEIAESAFEGSGLVTIDLSGVSTIGKRAFRDCDSLTELTVPASVESVGKKAFEDCDSLELITAEYLGKNADSNDGFSYAFGTSDSVKSITVNNISKIDKKTFKGAERIQSLTLGGSVTEIGKKSFKGFSELLAVALPASIETVGDSAFEGCSMLTQILGAEAVVNIGSGAFSDCESLGGIDIFTNLSTIGSGAFSGCDSITAIDLTVAPLESIGDGAFQNCINLVSVVLPTGLEAIPASAFKDCHSLDAISLPDSLIEVGNSAFESTALTSIDLKNVQTVGKRAFYGCENIISLTIPTSVTEVGKHAFRGCEQLAELTTPFLGKNEKSNEGFSYMFGYVSSIRKITVTELNNVKKNTFKGAETVQEIYLNEGVAKIGNNAFRNFGSLMYISLPSTLEEIGSGAFRDLNISEIDLSGTGLTKIGNNAFRNCDSLISMDFSVAPIQKLGKNIFYDCNSLQWVDFPEGITEIPAGTFYGCNSKTELDLPDTVTKIGKKAYARTSITSVTTVNVEKIGAKAFHRCDSLTYVELSDAVQKIGKKAFAGGYSTIEGVVTPFVGLSRGFCFRGYRNMFGFNEVKYIVTTSMKRVNKTTFKGAQDYLNGLQLNEGVTSIGRKSFVDYTALDTIVLPATLGRIGDKAFLRCYSLESVDLSQTQVTRIGSNTFKDCGNLAWIELPETLRSIGAKAFKRCNSLESLYLPDSVERIGRQVAADSGIYELRLSGSLKTISNRAFRDCYNLTDVTIPVSVKRIEKRAFKGSGIQSLDVQGDLNKIGKRAFKECNNLSYVHISSVKKIDKKAFQNCYSLSTVVIGNTDAKIGKGAFRGCDWLDGYDEYK